MPTSSLRSLLKVVVVMLNRCLLRRSRHHVEYKVDDVTWELCGSVMGRFMYQLIRVLVDKGGMSASPTPPPTSVGNETIQRTRVEF